MCSATITITPFADVLVEPAETVILTLSASPNYLFGSPSSATVTIADVVLNTVTIVATDLNASETGRDAGAFTITRTGPTSSLLQVSVSIGGTAANGIDYQGINSVIIILVGQASVTVPVTPLADAAIEPAETVIVTLTANPATYLVGSRSSATVTIADSATDAAPSVTTVSPAKNATDVALGANIQVNFNEGVQVNGNWFQIVCANSGTRTPANSTASGNFNGTNQGSVFTINPSANFTQGESCTGTIFAANVSDLDTNDPPDTMAANFQWTFTVAP